MRRTIQACALIAGASAAAAQTRFPTGTFTAGEDSMPLASGLARYQQWYSPLDLQAGFRVPVRIRAMAFLAGVVRQPGTTVDVEIRMAHLPLGQAPSPTFDNNLTRDNTLVVPRGVFTLVANPAPGARVFTFNFTREFPWDGQSGILIDVKVFGNGNNNQSYLYPCRTTVASPGQVTRLFAPGSPASQLRATVSQAGVGLVTEFDTLNGLTVSFGSGCAGSNAITPLASTAGGLPIPPNPTWTLTAENVLALAPCVLMMGGSRTSFAGTPLPIDLGLIGFPGCALRVEPLLMLTATASAAGIAQVPFPVPGVTLRRQSLFTQWFVLDSGAPNGRLAASQAQWHVFGG